MRACTGPQRLDMLVQMTEVEARQEDYSETIAFVGLVNALLANLEPGERAFGVHARGGVQARVRKRVPGCGRSVCRF